MKSVTMQCWGRRILVLLALVAAAGCANTAGMVVANKNFSFDVQAVRDAQGRVVRIDVDPTPRSPPQKGVYKGGHARIDLPKGNVHSMTWQAREPFEMKFETLLSDEGDGTGTIADPAEPGDWRAADGNAQTGVYALPLNLKVNRNRDKEVVTVKYAIRMVADKPFVLDPIIIVRR